MRGLLHVLLLLTSTSCQGTSDDSLYRLPDSFLIGAGTSAYQTEGAWNVSGKGVSFLDHRYRNASANGDVATDSYHHIKEDVALAKELQLETYRFSLSWTRILPTGDNGTVNPDGIRYYNELIDEVISAGMIPLVTMSHFDHPQLLLEKINAWHSPDMVDYFVNYARVVFRNFGDRVKLWVTLNEPNMFCLLFGSVQSSNESVQADTSVDLYYDCVHNQLLAHAYAYRMYQDEFADQGGSVGLTVNVIPARPDSVAYEDYAAAIRHNTFEMGLYFDPVVRGDYPDLVKGQVLKKSLKEGRSTSRLPTFNEQQQTVLKNSTDFLAINVYYGKTVSNLSPGTSSSTTRTSPASDIDANVTSGATTGGSFGTLFQTAQPWVMRDCLLWLRDHYTDMPILITENGVESTEDTTHDDERAAYYSGYLRELAKALNEDGVNVIGYTAWTLLDDFEWSRGYESKMGLIRVDFSSPDRTRTLKDSSSFFQELMDTRIVPLVTVQSDSSIAPIIFANPSTICLITYFVYELMSRLSTVNL